MSKKNVAVAVKCNDGAFRKFVPLYDHIGTSADLPDGFMEWADNFGSFAEPGFVIRNDLHILGIKAMNQDRTQRFVAF